MTRYLITGIMFLAAVFALTLASCGQQGDQAQVEPGTQTDQSAQAPGQEEMDSQQAMPSEPIDINSASSEELASIPGLDQTLAQNIIDYRESYGPFSSVDDLLQVNGMDQQTLDSIRGWVTVEQGETMPEQSPGQIPGQLPGQSPEESPDGAMGGEGGI